MNISSVASDKWILQPFPTTPVYYLGCPYLTCEKAVIGLSHIATNMPLLPFPQYLISRNTSLVTPSTFLVYCRCPLRHLIATAAFEIGEWIKLWEPFYRIRLAVHCLLWPIIKSNRLRSSAYNIYPMSWPINLRPVPVFAIMTILGKPNYPSFHHHQMSNLSCFGPLPVIGPSRKHDQRSASMPVVCTSQFTIPIRSSRFGHSSSVMALFGLWEKAFGSNALTPSPGRPAMP